MYDAKESEGKKRRHQVDTVVEGIGINRVRLPIIFARLYIDFASHSRDS